LILEDDIPPDLADWIQAECSDNISALNQVVVMYEYLDEDGESNWNFHVRGDNRSTRIIGLMEVVKLRMLTPLIRAGLDED
jgi:hypothetical protein